MIKAADTVNQNQGKHSLLSVNWKNSDFGSLPKFTLTILEFMAVI